MHYHRMRRNGTVQARARLNTGPCVVEDCERPQKSRHLCTMHYDRWLRTGDPLDGGMHHARDATIHEDPCAVTDCQHPVLAHGLCSAHYQRQRRARLAAEQAEEVRLIEVLRSMAPAGS
jgi:hypothetical protein